MKGDTVRWREDGEIGNVWLVSESGDICIKWLDESEDWYSVFELDECADLISHHDS